MSANYVMSEIEKTYLKLNIFPHRGSHPKELNERKTNFRQIFFKSYRIVYRIDEENSSVSIVLIADGRQNMQKLMADKLPK
jgi:plasmid stabilization system protein ParE